MNPDLSIFQKLTGLPMDALMGGPLSAAARANASMSMTQTKFILETCFTKVHVEAAAAVKGVAAVIDPVTGNIENPEIIGTPAIPAHDNYQPVMIVMSLTRGVITPGSPAIARDPNNPDSKDIPATATQIQNLTTQFNLPLLTIVPLNSLAVETVDVDFEMEVKSCFLEPREQGFHGAESVSIHGLAVYDSSNPSSRDKHYEKPNPSKYAISLHAGQLPLPKGVNTIIEAFTQAISPITVNAN